MLLNEESGFCERIDGNNFYNLFRIGQRYVISQSRNCAPIATGGWKHIQEVWNRTGNAITNYVPPVLLNV